MQIAQNNKTKNNNKNSKRVATRRDEKENEWKKRERNQCRLWNRNKSLEAPKQAKYCHSIEIYTLQIIISLNCYVFSSLYFHFLLKYNNNRSSVHSKLKIENWKNKNKKKLISYKHELIFHSKNIKKKYIYKLPKNNILYFIFRVYKYNLLGIKLLPSRRNKRNNIESISSTGIHSLLILMEWLQEEKKRKRKYKNCSVFSLYSSLSLSLSRLSLIAIIILFTKIRSSWFSSFWSPLI